MLARTTLYNALVNKHIGISERYHRFHDGATGFSKIISWVYLLWLNFAYYVLFCKFLGKAKKAEIYESKRLLRDKSESEYAAKTIRNYTVDDFVSKIKDFDVISFDVFDTLIFRNLALPTDVFYLIGEKLGVPNFKNIRIEAEHTARQRCFDKNGHTEIGLNDIWEVLESSLGRSALGGEKAEKQTELDICTANPFMLEVWQKLIALNKRIIIVSDMYLPADFISMLLEKNGFTGAKSVYVSCEYKKNKAKGGLFETVLRQQSGPVSVVHIGDNSISDVKNAKEVGLSVMPYINVNKNVLLYRPFDMSALVGSAYKSIVTNHIYNGLNKYSMEYEYGFIYGGLFVFGYCRFIHEYCKNHGISKKLFLSRDGDILKSAYDFLYPGEDTVYVYWSRKVATKLMADFDRHDYFRRFIYHKANQNYSIKRILNSMNLGFLTKELSDWERIWNKWLIKRNKKTDRKQQPEKFVPINADDYLTTKNADNLRLFIEAKWDKVVECYKHEHDAARKYYADVLHDADKAVAVDIGWAGSGALSLDYLINNYWELDCNITGIIAGTNTIHNTEPDATDYFLQSGKLVAYLYSAAHNRDLYKLHNPNKDFNVFWELLLSSPTPQFAGFAPGNIQDEIIVENSGAVKENSHASHSFKYIPESDITLQFGDFDANIEGINQIQKGIMDFVKIYKTAFEKYPYLYNISGRDAYAPMIVAASHGQKYLKAIEKKFDLKINVD